MSDFTIPEGATHIVVRIGEKIVAVADLRDAEKAPQRYRIEFPANLEPYQVVP